MMKVEIRYGGILAKEQNPAVHSTISVLEI